MKEKHNQVQKAIADMVNDWTPEQKEGVTNAHDAMRILRESGVDMKKLHTMCVPP